MTKLSVPTNNKAPMPTSQNLIFQIKLLLWKRYLESTKSKWDLLKVALPAVLMFSLMILLYSVFDFVAAGALEPFLVPMAFWIFTQRLVVQIMFEKSSRLQESMRMMGLSDVAYWSSYIISDGVILGFALSFLCTLFTVGGLFNEANFGAILGLLFVFCLSAVPFAFFICAFFDTPQTSGQATLGLLLGLFVVYIVVFVANTITIPYKAAQVICCLIPPLALQIGSGAFLKSYDGISIGSICGIMVSPAASTLHCTPVLLFIHVFYYFPIVRRHIPVLDRCLVLLSSLVLQSRRTQALVLPPQALVLVPYPC